MKKSTFYMASCNSKIKFRLLLISMIVFFVGNFFNAKSQNLTQSGFTGVIVPQYMGSGNTTRLPVVFRATVTGLTASTSYRYYTQLALATTFGTANSGVGNPLLISSVGGYTYSTSPGVSTAGTYETFTTDASGNYTGWFACVNTGNAAFTGGNVIYPTITLNGGGTSTTISKRLALDLGITILAFGAAGTTNGTFIQQTTSSATAKKCCSTL